MDLGAPAKQLPAPLRALHGEIRRCQGEGDLRRAAQLYPRLLEELKKVWGAGAVELAPYYYDYALALKLGGNRSESLKITEHAQEEWPSSFPLKTLAATTLAESAIARGELDPDADRLFREILTEGNLSKLKDLRVEPAILYAQWGEMLRLGSRAADALEVIDKGLSFDARHRQCRQTKAQLLLGLERPKEALPLLQDLVRERSAPHLELSLGRALLDSGDAAGALEKLTALLSEERKSQAGRLETPFETALKPPIATALIELGRHREAAQVLLDHLSRDPEDVPSLQQLSRVARALGAPPTAAALNRRIRQLVPREKILQSARQAQASGYASSVLYYKAGAAFLLGKAGEALELLAKAAQLSPKIALLHLELGRVHLALGRYDLAERDLREGLKQGGSPLMATELARVLSLCGDGDQARRLLHDSLSQPAGDGEAAGPGLWHVEEKSLLAARRARAFLELGEPGRAKEALDAGGVNGQENDETRLCRAEIALLERRLDLAEAMVDASYDQLSGGEAWARALQALLALRGEKSAAGSFRPPEDPSDLLDQPRLLGLPYDPPGLEASEGAARWRASLRSAHERRMEILQRMAGFADSDLVPLWRKLLSLYQELKAARKAREVAWYLVHLHPGGKEEWLALAETLSAPEEALARIAALARALDIAPGEKELEEKLSVARAGLDLGL